ncbi:MAG TPA: FtsX-like permease family protein [Candidatus Angelobacter sp.]
MWKTSPIFYVLAFSRQLSGKGMRQALASVLRSPDNSFYHLHVTDGLSNDPVRDQKIRSWSRLAFLLSLALIFVAGFNYCGLLIAQAPRRIAELRLKRVLGASVRRIIAENCYGPGFTVVVGFICACGIAIAGAWIVQTQSSGYLELRITWSTLGEVLGLELVLALALAAIVALIPAFRLMDDSGVPRLGYTSTSGRRAVFLLQGIVAVQIAFCIMVGFGTITIVDAVRSMSRAALGFNSNQLMIVPVGLASGNANLDFRTSSTHDFPMEIFTRQVLERATEALPSLRSIAAASCAPFSQPMKTITIRRADSGSLPSSTVRFCGVTQAFFETMENPVVQGRGFSSSELIGGISEIVINRKLAQELWADKSPLHQIVQLEQPELGLQFVAEVVGVTQDMRLSGKSATPEPALFLPLKSEVFGLSFPLYFLVKGPVSPHTLEMLANQQASLFMPSLASNAPYLVSEKLRSSSFEQTMRIYLAGSGAALVALIAFTGLYGVLIYFTNTRRKEIALRMCFGASRWDVRKSVIQPAIQCALIAIAISLLGWKGLAMLAASEWIGQAAWSWGMVLIIPMACVLASILISLVPANAAAKVAPGEILKEQ